MIKEWLFKKLLKNRIIFFEKDGEYHIINDIIVGENTVICSYDNREKELREQS